MSCQPTLNYTISIMISRPKSVSGQAASAESRKEAAKNYPVDYDEQVYNEEKAWGN
jgi:hypothetical protein